jgi:transducin (beta)-like 1
VLLNSNSNLQLVLIILKKHKIFKLAIMAFDWYDKHILTSGSSDSTVRMTDVMKGSQTCWSDHESDVNDIKWDPSRKYLASCSDDCTIRIWTRDLSEPLYALRGHDKPVITLDWNPKPPNGIAQLATYVRKPISRQTVVCMIELNQLTS